LGIVPGRQNGHASLIIEIMPSQKSAVLLRYVEQVFSIEDGERDGWDLL